MVNSDTAKPTQSSGKKLFFGLFIFPLIIAVGMAVLLCTVVLLTREDVSPESLITEIKTGSPSKRWQKAFELSNELNQGRGLLRESGVMKEVIHILTDAAEYDAQTRSYMAMALSRFEGPEVIGALRAALQAESEVDVQIHLIWALGAKEATEASDEVAVFLASEKEELRKVAAYVIGVLGNRSLVPRIEPLLHDTSRDVRWNAAVSLARLGSNAGVEELMKMLDRRLLEAQGDIGEEKIEEIMINAAKGAALLAGNELTPVLEGLAKQDQSLKVRQAAIDALKHTQV